eukprot:m.156710 g.156710  ORF g.156710 m.156710 type:complete len:408 (-) comp23635_c1_seq2:2533-3756(-)
MPSSLSPTMIDEMHQKILNSLQSMKGNADIFKRVSQAAAQWHNKLEETMDAERAFFGVLDELSRRAYSAPGMNDLGLGFNNLSDCAKGLSEMQQDVARSLKDEVVIPLDARLTADSRTAQRMTKEYNKHCLEQAESIHRAEKELDRVGKRARKSSSDANSMLQLRSAQRIVTEQTHELDALRARTLKRVLTEERSRYARLMAGVLDAFKVQIRQYQRSIPALGAVITVCHPICANPGELPRNFNPMTKRGGEFQPAASQPYNPGLPGRVPVYPPQQPMPHQMQRRSPSPEHAAPPVPHGRPFTPQQNPSLTKHQYVARYPFNGQDQGQLSFAAGHVIECDGDSDDNWQYGHNMITGNQGWFPVNFLDRQQSGSRDEETTGAVELPPVDYDDDGPQLLEADYGDAEDD